MHKKHLLWLGLPLLLIAIFILAQAWLPGRFFGAAIMLTVVIFLGIVFVLRFNLVFRD